MKHIDFKNGDHYEGSVNSQGQPHGKGYMSYKLNGYVGEYEGEWRDGKRCGKGKYERYTMGGGARHSYTYEGEWANDMENGFGTSIEDDERGLHLTTITTKYTGGFKDGKRHGHGKIEKDGYDGSFANGKEYFEGEFIDGRLSGPCVHIMVNGDKCEFPEGYCHGKGIYTFKDGTQFTAMWNGSLDFDTVEFVGDTKPLLLVNEYHHGFGYSESISCIIIARKGVQPYNEAVVLNNGDFHINSDSANLEITDVTDDSVTYIVKNAFIKGQGTLTETIRRGETKEHEVEFTHTGRMYDDDFEYTSGSRLIISCK